MTDRWRMIHNSWQLIDGAISIMRSLILSTAFKMESPIRWHAYIWLVTTSMAAFTNNSDTLNSWQARCSWVVSYHPLMQGHDRDENFKKFLVLNVTLQVRSGLSCFVTPFPFLVLWIEISGHYLLVCDRFINVPTIDKGSSFGILLACEISYLLEDLTGDLPRTYFNNQIITEKFFFPPKNPWAYKVAEMN